MIKAVGSLSALRSKVTLLPKQKWLSHSRVTPAGLSQVLNHTSLHELFLLVLDVGGPHREGLILLLANIPTIALFTSVIYATSLLVPCFMPGEADPWISLMKSLAAQLLAGFFPMGDKGRKSDDRRRGSRNTYFLCSLLAGLLWSVAYLYQRPKFLSEGLALTAGYWELCSLFPGLTL